MARYDHADPLLMPGTAESPALRLALALPLAGTPGGAYVQRRGIDLTLADAAGLRFDPDWHGRAAVLVGLYDQAGSLTAVHGRYLETLRGQNKMLTVGRRGGLVGVGQGWQDEPLILVEGVFDALSLAACGWAGVATIGRWAPWLPTVCAHRSVWLGFDGNAPGEAEVQRYTRLLPEATVHRLLPPGRCKDWNTALVRRGRAAVLECLQRNLQASTGPLR